MIQQASRHGERAANADETGGDRKKHTNRVNAMSNHAHLHNPDRVKRISAKNAGNGRVAKKVTEEEDKKSPEYKAKKAKLFQMKVAQAEKVKNLLVREGFASDAENAEILMHHMSDEWFETIMEGWQRPNVDKARKQADRHREYAQGKGNFSAFNMQLHWLNHICP